MPDLGSFEAQIEESHNQFLASFSSRLRHALRMGQLLLQVKERLGRSPFTDWVESRCPFSAQSAKVFMRVARNEAIVEEGSKRQFAPGLTLSARDDEENTAADPGATTRSEDSLSDSEWLASLKIRQKLANPRAFDFEATMWRRTWPEIERTFEQFEACAPELLEAIATGGPLFYGYSRWLAETIEFPRPDAWRLCLYCKGKGRKGREKEPCPFCGGGGFNSTRNL
jgi:hypothetical protein